MGIGYDPYAAAAALGLTVAEANLPHGHMGEYWHDHQMILLTVGMTYRERRSVLAHEVQHAIAGDMSTVFGPLHRTQELRARKATARALIDPSEFADSAALRDWHIPSIAHDLDVTPDVVEDWVAINPRFQSGAGEDVA